MLQRLAAEHSVRVTILGFVHKFCAPNVFITNECRGDVHLAGIGQFMSNPKLKVAKQNDFRYMPNIISSAIVNAPPPNSMLFHPVYDNPILTLYASNGGYPK
jgi:hypothetical protein